MKIQLASDIHTEFWSRVSGVSILERVAKTDADVIVLAGDIGSQRNGSPTWLPHVNELLQDRKVPVIKISGNHEYYHGVVEDVDDMHANLARLSDGAFFSANPGVIKIGDVTFILATNWASGYSADDRDYCANAMNDYRMIRTKAPAPGEENETEIFVRDFCIEDSERLCATHAAFIFDHLTGMTSEQRAKTVVVTHHAPTERSIMPVWRRHRANGCYQNSYDKLIHDIGPAVWMHGHTHGNADYVINKTHVIANPLGYPVGYARDGSIAFENSEYKTDLVVEV